MATKPSTAPEPTTDNPGATQSAPGAPEAPPVANPSAGGSYLRDPVTGVLFLDIPSATQE